MANEQRRQRDYWNGLSTLSPETSVFDPNDQRGEKNAYIASIRDATLHAALAPVIERGGVVLDVGCGTGSASLGLLRRGCRVVGLDIARALLEQARTRCDPERSVFVAIDGRSLPVADAVFDAAVTYVVLSYVVDDDAVLALLSSIRASLKPGARLVAIEQCRRARSIVEDGLKVHRSIQAWRTLFRSAGFRDVESRTVRSGRFPTTALIRAGWVPRRLWPTIRSAERVAGRLLPVLPGDYAEVAIEGVA